MILAASAASPARGAGRARGAARGTRVTDQGLRRSRRVMERQAEEENNDDGDVEETVLLSSSQTTISVEPSSQQLSAQSAQSSQSTQSSASRQVESTPPVVIIDADEQKDIVLRSRSNTPIVNFLGETVYSTSPQPSGSRTPAELPIQRQSFKPSQHDTPTEPPVQTDQSSKSSQSSAIHTSSPSQLSQPSSRRATQKTDAPVTLYAISKMLEKQGKQMRALYVMQKNALEKIDSIDKKVKKLIQKSMDLSPKVFSVSNNNIVYYRYLTL